jgi:broad specificity phosphatase PhoE
MTAPLRLYYIRHGETAWSLSGQHTSRADIPLTANGEDGARALGPALEAINFTQVLTSPRQRAQRTCELAGLDAVAEVEPDLTEWDYGDYEGRRSADIESDRPGWSLFRDGCPDGESPAQVSHRADRLIGRLAGLQGNVALFSHGHFGAVLATRWIELPVIEGRHFPLDPCSVSVLGFAAHHPEDRVVVRWNTTPGRLEAG